MVVPTYDGNHSDEAISRLIAKSKGKPNMEAFFRSKASGRFDILQASESEAQKYTIKINGRIYVYDSTLFDTASDISTALVPILNGEVSLSDDFESYSTFPAIGPLGEWQDIGATLGTFDLISDAIKSRSGLQCLSPDLSSVTIPTGPPPSDLLVAQGLTGFSTDKDLIQHYSFYFKIPADYPGALDTGVTVMHPGFFLVDSTFSVISFLGVWMSYSAGSWKFDLSWWHTGTKTDLATGFEFSLLNDNIYHRCDISFAMDGSVISIEIDEGIIASGTGAFINFGSQILYAGNAVWMFGTAGVHSLPDTYIDDYGIDEPTQIVIASKFDLLDDFLYVKSLPTATPLDVSISSNLAFKNIGLVDQIQEIEDVLFQLLLNRSIDTATGVQLDRVGRIVGLRRAGSQSDSDYRELLLIQIQSNLSNGEINRFIQILKSFTGSTTVSITELFPAALQAIFDGNAPDDIHNRMDAVLAGGVELVLIQAELTDYFGFDGDPDALGFSSVLDITSGGTLAGKVL